MKIIASNPAQTTQRVKVGMIGLAAVLLLIGLAAAILTTVNRDRQIAIAGGARPEVVATMVSGNGTDAASTSTHEPLTELGVAPSAAGDGNQQVLANGQAAK